MEGLWDATVHVQKLETRAQSIGHITEARQEAGTPVSVEGETIIRLGRRPKEETFHHPMLNHLFTEQLVRMLRRPQEPRERSPPKCRDRNPGSLPKYGDRFLLNPLAHCQVASRKILYMNQGNEETSHQHGTEGMKDRWGHGLPCHSWIVVEIRRCCGLEHEGIRKPHKLRTNSREVRKVVEDHHGDPYEDHGT
ncbi:MAG: hypothetical protein GY696_12685, partial [Gammaproteobacteria bacterium]|nr:hypothetical protein [Gammaproteobacteria bacterium]